MTDKEKNTSNQASSFFSSPTVRLIGILVIGLLVTIVLANITANETLLRDTAEDVPGDVDDIAGEVFDELEAVQEASNAAAAEIADVDAASDELPTLIAETVDESVLLSVARAGIYQPDGDSLVLDVADPLAVGDSVADASVSTIEELDGMDAVEGEAIWLVVADGMRYVTPIESAENAFLWMEVSGATLTELLRIGAEGEALFAETQTGYAILVEADGTVLAEYNAPAATAEQVSRLLGNLTEETYDEDGEYYQVASDPINEEASFISQLQGDINDLIVIGSVPTSEAPSQNIVESTLNLFDVSEVGDTTSAVVERGVAFLNEDVGWLFRGLRWPIEQVINLFEDVLLTLPWFITIAITGVIAALAGGRQVAIISVVGMFAIGLLGLWDLTMTTLAMLLTSMAFCVVVGIPVGIWAASSDRVNEIVRSVLDAMQTIHPFVYLVPIVVLFGIGKVPGTIATIIFALPPMVRLTNLGIRQVPEDVVEASKAFGSSDWQLLRDVQIPLALPSIMAGVNQTLMLSLSMVVIVALIAGGGLGQEIYRAIGRADTGRAVVAGVAVLLLAVVIDRISQGRAGKRRAED